MKLEDIEELGNLMRKVIKNDIFWITSKPLCTVVIVLVNWNVLLIRMFAIDIYNVNNFEFPSLKYFKSVKKDGGKFKMACYFLAPNLCHFGKILEKFG